MLVQLIDELAEDEDGVLLEWVLVDAEEKSEEDEEGEEEEDDEELKEEELRVELSAFWAAKPAEAKSPLSLIRTQILLTAVSPS